MKAVFDTCILIDFLRGNEDARTEFSHFDHRIISIITYIETLVGAKKHLEEKRIRGFLSHFELAPLTESIADKSIELRLKHHLKIPDAIIYATTKVHGCLLITRNTKDFHIAWPDVRVPYQVKPD